MRGIEQDVASLVRVPAPLTMLDGLLIGAVVGAALAAAVVVTQVVATRRLLRRYGPPAAPPPPLPGDASPL